MNRKNLKKLCVLLCSMICLSTGTASARIIGETDIKLKVGLEEAEFEAPLREFNGKLYAPVRDLCEMMRIPVEWNEEERQAEVKMFNRKTELVVDRETVTALPDGVVPDAETAYKIGKPILERACGRELEYEDEEYVYKLETSFFSYWNAWMIEQAIYDKNGNRGFLGVGTLNPTIFISKDSGEIFSIITETDALDTIEAMRASE